MGRDDQLLGGLPLLPLDLANVGMPGCVLLHSNEVFGLATTVSGGLVSFSHPVPNNVLLLGQHFYMQAFCYAPGANPLEVVASNGIDWLVGDQ